MKRTLGMVVVAAVLLLAGAALAQGGNGVQARSQSGMGGFIEFLGVVTYLCMAAAFLSGWWMKKNRKVLFMWHKRLAITALSVASLHGLLVMIVF